MHNKKFFLFLNSDINQPHLENQTEQTDSSQVVEIDKDQPQPTGSGNIAMMKEAELRSVIEQLQKASEQQAQNLKSITDTVSKFFDAQKKQPEKAKVTQNIPPVIPTHSTPYRYVRQNDVEHLQCSGIQ